MDPNKYAATAFGRADRTAGPHGYTAYFAEPIPRSIELSPAVITMLVDAESALGQLHGVGQLLPNPYLLINPYVRREAIASTRIEGTQASLAEMFEFDATGGVPNQDLEEVINYVKALNTGIDLLDTLPISTRLIREIHEVVLAGVRGRERQPGQFRTSQNWIGDGLSTIESASFVPPPPDQLSALLDDWEFFANDEDDAIPLLIRNALLHYQFETIHPFNDGNGRLGRLLIVFHLIAHGRLSAPLLYVSSYFDRDRDRYIDCLQRVRETGEIEPWLRLFLEAVATQARDAVQRATKIMQLREHYRELASSLKSVTAGALVDLVCESPVLSPSRVEARLQISRPSAIANLRKLVQAGVLVEEASGARSQLRFVARELLAVLSDESANES